MIRKTMTMIAVLAAFTMVTGCATIFNWQKERQGVSSSLVDFLYPGEQQRTYAGSKRNEFLPGDRGYDR